MKKGLPEPTKEIKWYDWEWEIMKPEGRKIVKFPCKRDVHPKKGWINWWESIGDYISRNTRKQKLRKEIDNETLESTY